MTAKEVIKFAKENKAACVDLKFMDFLGTWQHFTIPMTELSEGLFDEGSGFDGSSIRGWQPINASDMLIVPDPDHGGDGSVHRGADAQLDRQRRRPDHQGRVLARSAPHRQEGRGSI